MKISLVPQIVIGAAVASALHLYQGWWLDAGQRVLVTLVAVAVGTGLVGATGLNAAAFGAGVAGGMTAILFAIGPGNLFPIVIAIGTTMIALAVLAGWSVRAAIDWLWPRRIPHH
jgi:hypothetical protein